MPLKLNREKSDQILSSGLWLIKHLRVKNAYCYIVAWHASEWSPFDIWTPHESASFWNPFGVGSYAHYSMIFTSRGFSSKDTGYGGIGSLAYHAFFGIGPPRLLMRVSPPWVSKSSRKAHRFGITWRNTSSIAMYAHPSMIFTTQGLNKVTIPVKEEKKESLIRCFTVEEFALL